MYAPQQGRPGAEKDRFYDQLHAVTAKIPLSEVFIPLGDWNGHVGAAADGYEGVHGVNIDTLSSNTGVNTCFMYIIGIWDAQ